MLERSVEFWVALLSAAVYVFLNSKEKAIHYRVLMVASSSGFGFALAKEVSSYVGIGETLSGILVIVFSYLIIDVLTAVVSDRAFVKELIKARFK